jgi:hypothetical protein
MADTDRAHNEIVDGEKRIIGRIVHESFSAGR